MNVRVTRRMRVLAILWAVLQFALPAGASWADAQVERADGPGVIHIESATGSSCRPVHSAECAICQFLSHNLAPLAGPVSPALAGEAESPVVATVHAWPALAGRYTQPSTGPPLG